MEIRFRQTAITNEAWYRKLSPVNKCAWNYLCDVCDKAGVWTIDTEAMEFSIGAPVEIEAFIEAVNVGKNRIEKFGSDKLFLTGFVEFQYGQLSKHCKPHVKIIALLQKYGLLERVCVTYPEGTSTLQERTGQEEEGKGKDEKGSGEKQKKHTTPNVKPVKKNNETKDLYETLIAELSSVPEIQKKKAAITEFIKDESPQFITPYMDLWNLSVGRYGLSQVETASAGRIKKFETRIREPSFDFIKILIGINQSDYLQGKKIDWKVDWDWIFENDTNYLKIIEEKYKN